MPKARRSTRHTRSEIRLIIENSKNKRLRQRQQGVEKGKNAKKNAQKKSNNKIMEKKKIKKGKSSIRRQLKKENYGLLKKLEVPIKKISHLSQNKRLKLKQTHPKLAPYLFLSVREKRKYFEKKNKQYRQKMKSEKVKKEKRIKFLDADEVVYFNRLEPSAQIENLEISIQKIKRKAFKYQNYYYNQIQ